MALSRFRKTRKPPADLRYYPYFPAAYRAFIYTIPYENRIHIRATAYEERAVGDMVIEDDSGVLLTENPGPIRLQAIVNVGGDDLTGDGSFEKPFANIFAGVNYVVNRQIKPPYSTWAFVIYPGDYVEKGWTHPQRKTWPDLRVSLFTDFFENPIPKLPQDQRYSPDDKGKLTVDNYKNHAFLRRREWEYNFHFIGAGGNTRVLYQTFPDYYDPVTKKYRGNFAVDGRNKLSYLGLWPTRYKAASYDRITRKTIPATGGSNMYEGGFDFEVPADGTYTVKYYVQDMRPDNTRYRVANAITNTPLVGNTQQTGLYWEERYNYYYIDSTNANPTGNIQLQEKGNITIHGIANISTTKYYSGSGSLWLNYGGAFTTYEANDILDFRGNDFTAEGYFYFGKRSSSGVIMSNRQIANRRYGFYVTFSGARLDAYIYDNNFSGRTIRLSSRTISLEGWHHIAYMRSNTDVSLFVDGFLVDKKSTGRTTYAYLSGRYVVVQNTYKYNVVGGAGSFYIGGEQSLSEGDTRIYGRGGNVWVDSVRVSNIARYAGATVDTPNVYLTATAGDFSNALILNFKNDYIDTSPDPRATIRIGPVLTSAYSPYDEGTNYANSILFNTSSFLRVPYASHLSLTNDFTIDFWLLQPSTARANFTVFAQQTLPNQRSFLLQATTYGFRYLMSFYGTSWNVDRIIETGRVWDDWVHYRFSKNGTTVKLFQMGQLIYYRNESLPNVHQSNANIHIGSSVGNSSEGTAPALLNNFRIVSNSYMTANSFGVPDADWGIADGDTETKLLIGQTGNCLVDASTYNNTIETRYLSSANGNVFAIAVNPFDYLQGTSYYFNGGVSFFKLQPSSRLDPLTTANFTVELWFKFTDINKNTGVRLLSTSPTTSLRNGDVEFVVEGRSIYFNVRRLNSNVKLQPDILPIFTGQQSASGSSPLSSQTQWNHFAWVSDNGVWKFYVNGADSTRSYATGINTGAVAIKSNIAAPDIALTLNTDAGLYVARPPGNSPGWFFRGAMHGLRIADFPRYTSAFTVPNEPFTEDGGTSLLTLDKPGLFSRAGPGGDHSVAFNGINTTYVIYSGNTGLFEVGSSNFTIECYAKFNTFPPSSAEPGGVGFAATPTTAASGARQIIGNYGSGLLTGLFIGPTKIYAVSQNVVKTAANHGMSTGVWYHIAMERNGNTLTYFIDGNPVGTASHTGSFSSANENYFCVGGRFGSNNLDVSVFNVRVSWAALYNGSSFSIPTAAYTKAAGDTTTKFIGLTKASWGFERDTTTWPNTNAFSYWRQGFIFFSADTPFVQAPSSSEIISYGQSPVEGKGSPFNTVDGGSQFFLNATVYNPQETITIGTSDWTVEGYVYKYGDWRNRDPLVTFANVRGGGDRVVLSCLSEGGTYVGYYLRWPDAAKPDLTSYAYKEQYIARGTTPPLRTWFHLALVKKDASLTIYENGQLVYTAIDARMNLQQCILYLGGEPGRYMQSGALFSNWRVSRVAQYNPQINYPDFFDSNEANFANNVGMLAHFDNEYYRRKGTPPNATDEFSQGYNHGFAQTLYLTAGKHTINVSAVAHNFQGKWGGDISDEKKVIIWESRRDARDNNLGYFRDPESSARGIHVRYPGAKPFYYQNALFGPPETVLLGDDIPDKTVLKNGNYNPFEPGFDLKIGQTKNLVIKDPVAKTSETIVVNGKMAQKQRQRAARGKFINMGIEGSELMFTFSGGAKYITMENCTFMFPNVAFDPTYNNRVVHYNNMSATYSSGNLIIKNSVFGHTSATFDKAKLKSTFQQVGDPFWYEKPQLPLFGANATLNPRIKNGPLPVIQNSAFGAQLAANTFVVLNDPLPAQIAETNLNFRYATVDTGRYINVSGANITHTLAFFKANATNTYYDANSGPASSLELPRTGTLNLNTTVMTRDASNVYPHVISNKALLPATSNNWKISLNIYHNGIFRSELNYETIFINGDFRTPSRTEYYGMLANSSIQLSAFSQTTFSRLDRSVVPAVTRLYPGRERFKLQLYRRGSVTGGDRTNETLSSAGWYYVNTWYRVDITYADDVLSMLVNNEIVAQKDYNALTTPQNFPQHSFRNHNTTRFIVGAPRLYGMYWSGFGYNSWQGYIQYIRSYTGSEQQESQVGVYSGNYRWFLPWQL